MIISLIITGKNLKNIMRAPFSSQFGVAYFFVTGKKKKEVDMMNNERANLCIYFRVKGRKKKEEKKVASSTCINPRPAL